MPDIEEFSRLIGQINNIASESETYRKLQASLKTLNEKITPLMKPSQNGIWELLSDQKRNELLEGYTEVGTFIQEYLREVREQGPDHPGAKANANVSDMVSTLAEFIREDTQMLRQYDPAADPKSLPTLFEEARTVTLQPNDRQLSRMGGALSTRIPLTINLNGQKMAGVFTVNQKYDPERIFNRIMDKAISLIPAKKKAEGTALLRGLLNSNNRFKEKGSDVAEDEIDTPKGKILAFMRNILKKERGIYSIPTDELANAIGYLSGQPPQKVLDTLGPKAIRCLCNDLINGELIVNGNARLPEKANIGIRNVAMYRTAQLFGVPEVVCRSVPMKIKVGNQIVEGTFMEKADGIDIHHPTKTTHAVDRRPLTDYDPDGLRKAADLQVLDFICGNIDRHGGNMFYQVNLAGKFCGVQGIDNDTSFGRLVPDRGTNHLLPVHKLQLISMEMAEKVINTSDDQLRMTLHGLIEPECIEAAVARLHMVQNQIAREKLKEKDLEEGPHMKILPIRKENWGSPVIKQHLEGHDYGGIFTKIRKNMATIAMKQNSILREHPKFGTEVGNENRATEGGAFAQYDKAGLMMRLMKNVTNARGTSANFEDMKQAVKEYRDFQANLVMRMKQAKEKVRNGTADEKDIYDQRISTRDLREMRDMLQKIKDTADHYKDEKIKAIGGINRAKKYQRRRIETAEMISKFASESLELTPEEQKTLLSNQRRTSEEIGRQAIRSAGARLPSPGK